MDKVIGKATQYKTSSIKLQKENDEIRQMIEESDRDVINKTMSVILKILAEEVSKSELSEVIPDRKKICNRVINL